MCGLRHTRQSPCGEAVAQTLNPPRFHHHLSPSALAPWPNHRTAVRAVVVAAAPLNPKP